MSLKAKLEAVIYAAEEPVTLAQLAVLFAADALEWKAQQEASSAAQPYLGEEFAPLEPPQTTKPDEDATGEPEAESEPEPELVSATAEEASEPAPKEDLEPAEEAAAEAATEANSSEADELEARRLARLRDRESRAVIRQLLDELIDEYISDGRGVEIREIAGGFRMATKPECHDAVRHFVRSIKPALKLSLPALETLAVIAYKQPVTAPEVNEIRGVDSSAVFGSLLARKLISTAGRKPVIGRPILYKTTREFLLRFGLRDVSELPSMEEFEKLAALELDEPESEDSATRNNPALGPSFDEAASEPLEDASSDEIEPEMESSEPTETAATAVSNES
jgi:segregation and condensation protein B